MDLATAVGPTTPRIVIDNLGDPVDAALLSALASRVSLRTWPELREVSGNFRTQAVSSDRGGDRRAYVEARLGEPLADRWYVLRLDALPSGLSWPMYGAQHVFSDGSFGVRFRVGSEPTLRAIRACNRGNGRFSFLLDFSERVVAESDIASVVQITQHGATCRATSEAARPVGDDSITQECSPFDVTRSVEVTLNSGLRSLAGATVGLPQGGARHAFTVDALQEWGTGCRILRL